MFVVEEEVELRKVAARNGVRASMVVLWKNIVRCEIFVCGLSCALVFRLGTGGQ